jgi:glyoxylase-like metal-dependent hydrolase (beta-lactamase superfamily II)
MQVFSDVYLLGWDDCSQGVYLWDTGERLLLIDPSYSRYQLGIETQVRQLGWSVEDVKWVLLTHMHWDHTQAAAHWERRGATINIHSGDKDYVTGRLDPEGPDPIEPVENPETFEDSQRLRFGQLELTAIHTPGHTPGATCFSTKWRGRGVLISGDIALHRGRHAWMGAEYCNWGEYLASLWKLNDHSDAPAWQTMLPGHGTIDLEGAQDSLYAVIQIVSEVISRRRSGEEIGGINAYKFFWQLKHGMVDEPKVLRV